MDVLDFLVTELLLDERLGSDERMVRIAAEMYPVESVRALASKASLTWQRTDRAVKALVASDWMRLAGFKNCIKPLATIPRPVQVKLAKHLEDFYNLAPHRGEFLMKCYLKMRIHSHDYVENAHPEYLTNVSTNEKLEYDMLFRSLDTAYEYNGPQHMGETFSGVDEKAVKAQLTRDSLKRGLSTQNGIRLIEVTSTTITPPEVEKLIPSDIPRRTIDEDGPYYKALLRLAVSYANKVPKQNR